MTDKDEPVNTGGLADTRARSRGWPLAFMVLLAIGALIFTWRGIISITDSVVNGNYGTAVVTFIAGLAWVLGSVGLIHNGRRMRIVATISWSINVIGAIAGIFLNSGFARVNPWFNGGETYFFLPTIGAVLALAWLYWSAPANVASRGASS